MNRSTRLSLFATLLALWLTGVYWNHFDNGFYFDDIHTIVNNEYIRSLKNIPAFFTNIETFGTMPTNRGYRPIVTLLNAIDYRLGGNNLNPIAFHVSIFFWYLVQGIILYKLILTIFRKAGNGEPELRFVALLTTAFYMFHTANAETINYIIARSDSFSTLCLVGSLALYQNKLARKWLIYLIPFAVGLLTKEVALMLIPILILYNLFFEKDFLLNDMKGWSFWKKSVSSVFAVLPAIVVGIGLISFNLFYMNNPEKLSTGLAHPRIDYLTSQFVVITHYLSNFILPLNLSVDPDFKVTSEIISVPKIFGFVIILGLHLLALWGLSKRKYIPISFGILWFFVWLIPTSTINPLTQVANDHRTFIPYIGLCMAVGWSCYLIYKKLEKTSMTQGVLRLLTTMVVLFVFIGHSYGTYQRNEIWGNNETLWGDAVEKGPGNGRAQMNYGLVLMRKGEYERAEPHFQTAVNILPYWPYSHINLAILKDATGDWKTAESHFTQALRYGLNNPEPYYYYARSLAKRGRLTEAVDLLNKGHKVSPKHVQINQLREQLKTHVADPEEKLAAQLKLVAKFPTVDNYINLSLIQYQQKDYQACIISCLKAIELNPESEIAYNNICSAYNAMKEWQKAATACEKALEINPNFDRARNNLNWAKSQL